MEGCDLGFFCLCFGLGGFYCGGFGFSGVWAFS